MKAETPAAATKQCHYRLEKWDKSGQMRNKKSQYLGICTWTGRVVQEAAAVPCPPGSLPIGDSSRELDLSGILPTKKAHEADLGLLLSVVANSSV